jgi:hypothetical protein
MGGVYRFTGVSPIMNSTLLSERCMQPGWRILVLKVILKSMLLFAVLWLLWVMLSSVPGGPKPRLRSGAVTPFTGLPFVAILPHIFSLDGTGLSRQPVQNVTSAPGN